MSQAFFVELMTASGDVLQRYRFDNLPVRIGRAYDNDIILDDPYVAAHHAIVEQNQLDELTIRDLGSINGIKRNHQRDTFFVVDGNTSYQIGHSDIRIRLQDFVVPAEKMDLSDYRWDGWLASIIALLIIGLNGLFTQWSQDFREQNFSEYLLALVGTFTAAAAWVGAWSLLNRLLSGRTRVGRHALIAAFGLLASSLWENLSSLIAYALSWESLATFTAHPGIIIGAITIYYHLMSIGVKHSERIKFYVGGLALFASVVVLVQNYQTSHYLRDKLYMSTIYPPAVRISEEITLDDLSKNIADLKQKADGKRKEQPKD